MASLGGKGLILVVTFAASSSHKRLPEICVLAIIKYMYVEWNVFKLKHDQRQHAGMKQPQMCQLEVPRMLDPPLPVDRNQHATL